MPCGSGRTRGSCRTNSAIVAGGASGSNACGSGRASDAWITWRSTRSGSSRRLRDASITWRSTRSGRSGRAASSATAAQRPGRSCGSCRPRWACGTFPATTTRLLQSEAELHCFTLRCKQLPTQDAPGIRRQVPTQIVTRGCRRQTATGASCTGGTLLTRRATRPCRACCTRRAGVTLVAHLALEARWTGGPSRSCYANWARRARRTSTGGAHGTTGPTRTSGPSRAHVARRSRWAASGSGWPNRTCGSHRTCSSGKTARSRRSDRAGKTCGTAGSGRTRCTNEP